MTEQVTKAYQQYDQGVDYKTRIDLYRTVDVNERFFSNDHWKGIPHENLPTPIVPFIKRACVYLIAAMTDRRTKMRVTEILPSYDKEKEIIIKQISTLFEVLWERLKMDYMTKRGLRNACVTGDYIQYFLWDTNLKTGQPQKGDISTQIIDNVCYYPGNPNSPDVQSQPYIILTGRELVASVRKEAQDNKQNFELITGDSDTDYTSGDRGKIELEDHSKVTVLTKLFKKDGTVWIERSTKSCVISPEKNTKLERYPVALMNWEERSNSCHGTAEATGLVPNQVYINKMMALAQVYQFLMSFPKTIFNGAMIEEWDNTVGGAIKASGDPREVAFILQAGTMSFDVWRGIETTLAKSMEMMGATDVALGNIKNPDNTSAFIATRDAAMAPLQSKQERFYEFVEDVGMIWLDYIKAYYKGRMIPIKENDQILPIPMPDLDKLDLAVKIDVGPSHMWSEVQMIDTANKLLNAGLIKFSEYVQMVPEGHVPDAEKLKERYKEVDDLQIEATKAGLTAQIAQAQMAIAQTQMPQEMPQQMPQ